MQATPVTRRAPDTAPTLGMSPTAKRAVRRDVVGPTQGNSSVTQQQLIDEVTKLSQQSIKDQTHFDETTDQINNHAFLIDDLKKEVTILRKDVLKLASETVDNDSQLKRDVQKLETVVTSQGNTTVTLTEDVKRAIQEIVNSG